MPRPNNYLGNLVGQLPAPTPSYIPKAMLPKLAEKDVLGQCDRLMAQTGHIVESYEQRRASNICLGLPDRRYVRPIADGVCFRLWVEGKRPGGKLTREQHAWLVRENESGGHATVIDSVDVLVRLLALCRHSIPPSELRRECAQLIALTAQRGFRAS